MDRWLPQAEGQGITLTLNALSDLPIMNLDPIRISQALGNVIRNALQHTDSGGQVDITAKPKEDEYVEISIADDGMGIDSVDLPHIFNRVYRTDQSRNRRTGGTGLGLSIARAIIEAHSGTIGITSDGIGLGTSVKLELPLR